MVLKPKPGLQVRDPVSKMLLPAGGREVQLTSYWQRRLDCGDVVAVLPAATAPSAPAPVLWDSYPSDSDEVKP